MVAGRRFLGSTSTTRPRGGSITSMALHRRSGTMKISARNQLAGTVKTVTEGTVMSEVVVDIGGGQEVVAAITAESARRLGLATGKKVVAIIKSTEVMLAVDD
jgi:molybdate transport system regulatory protein